MYNAYHMYGSGIGAPGWVPFFGLSLAVVILWSVFWKGLALWHSARRGQEWWFVAMLLLNTAGILEIVYLFGVAKLSFGKLFSKQQ